MKFIEKWEILSFSGLFVSYIFSFLIVITENIWMSFFSMIGLIIMVYNFTISGVNGRISIKSTWKHVSKLLISCFVFAYISILLSLNFGQIYIVSFIPSLFVLIFYTVFVILFSVFFKELFV